MTAEYIFKSERLGFRNWLDKDLAAFVLLNSDIDVMAHFPLPLTKEESKSFMSRLKDHYSKYKFNYFAVEKLENNEFIGFIGLAHQKYDSIITPNIDIGWRLKKDAWGKGFATEGAKRCLKYGFEVLNIQKIISTCTINNMNSENVMAKIGMIKKSIFNHPKLENYPEYQKCIYYEIINPNNYENTTNT